MSSSKTLNEKIAGESRIFVNKEVGGAEDEKTVKVQILGGDGSGATMVALDASDCDDRVGTLRNGVGHQELQFPHFVSTELHS